MIYWINLKKLSVVVGLTHARKPCTLESVNRQMKDARISNVTLSR